MNNRFFLSFVFLFLGGILLISTAFFLPSQNKRLLTASLYTPPQCSFHVGLTPNQVKTNSELSLKQEAILLKLFFTQAVLDSRGVAICKETDSLNTCLARFQNLCYQKGLCQEQYDGSQDATIDAEIRSYLCSLWSQRYTKIFDSWTKVTSLFTQKNTSLPSWLSSSYDSYLAFKEKQIQNQEIVQNPYSIQYIERQNTYLWKTILSCTYNINRPQDEYNKECNEFYNQYFSNDNGYIVQRPIPREVYIPHNKVRMQFSLKSSKDDKLKIEFYTKLCDKILSSQVISLDKEIKAGQTIDFSFIWTEPLSTQEVDDIVGRYVGKTWNEIGNDPAVCKEIGEPLLNCIKRHTCVLLNTTSDQSHVFVENITYQFGLKITTMFGQQFVMEPDQLSSTFGWQINGGIGMSSFTDLRYFSFSGSAQEQQNNDLLKQQISSTSTVPPSEQESSNIFMRTYQKIRNYLKDLELTFMPDEILNNEQNSLPNSNKYDIIDTKTMCLTCSDGTSCEGCSSSGYRCHCAIKVENCKENYYKECSLVDDGSCKISYQCCHVGTEYFCGTTPNAGDKTQGGQCSGDYSDLKSCQALCHE